MSATMNEYNLRPLWDAILEVYKEVYKICKKHDLRIYVAYGTEIGALRHHGFIPWDDDFDLLMPRSDYEKFMEYAKTELPPYLKWHSIENDSNYRLLFGKVYDERRDRLEKVQKASSLDIAQGIFVDVFPMDGLPSTKFGVFCWHCVRSFLRRIVKVSNANLQRFIKIFDYDKCSNVACCLSSLRFPRYVFKRIWFAESKMVPFEDVEVPVPIMVEEHLNALYGDYRKLPPESDRHPTHQLVPREENS